MRRDNRGELDINGTIHLRARDYDPKTGTFSTRDPLDGVNGTTTIANPYHYVNNDPLNRQDPTGLKTGDGDFNVQLVSFRQQAPAAPDPCALMGGVGIPRDVCQKLLGLGGTDFSSLGGEIDQVNCNWYNTGCNLVFSEKLTGLLADLDSVLNGLSNVARDKKAWLNVPDNQSWAKDQAVNVYKSLTEKQWNQGVPVILAGINKETGKNRGR